ncbi:MAG: VOC family protein [Hyphomicrobiales bacterium]
MITIKHVDHISMAAADWRAQSSLLQKLLGFKFLHNWEQAPGQDFVGCVSQVPGTDIEFEVIQPATSDSFVQKFLDERGPGLHHITMEVPSIDEAAAELERLGITPFGGISFDGEWRLTYIHPKDSGGILYQLFEPTNAHHWEVDRTITDHGVTNLKRVDHVSMAVPDLDRQVEWQQRVFGMEPQGRWTDEHLGYHGCVMRIPNSQLQFEMIAPSRPDSFVQRFIDERRPGMHHICCEVESVEAAIEGLRAQGIEPHGGLIESDWKRHTFLHPRDSGGVLFQLFEEN